MHFVKSLFLLVLPVAVLSLAVSAQAKPTSSPVPSEPGMIAFWSELQKLCSKAFTGMVVADTTGDVRFKDKPMVMHVRSCEKDRIRIPFFVGEDRSRTWVLTRDKDRILLKHDHRHEDGKPDAVTMYGGWTTNTGSADRQVFPADQETVKMLPAAASNIWWIELIPGNNFTYNLRRIGSDRLFTVKFNLTKAVAASPAPWGWKD